jgi:diaminobutyrate-2-oxoglutarate transaminase
VPNVAAPGPPSEGTAGPGGEAVKLLPPLTITDAELDQGLGLLADTVRSVC